MVVTNKHLKLHVEELPAGAPSLAHGDLPQLAPLCRAFERATGWQLRCQQSAGELGEAWSAPISNVTGKSGGRLALFPTLPPGGPSASANAASQAALDLADARPLALSVASLLAEISRLRHALWQREAELAAGVPVSARPDEGPHLAERLEAVLKGGAEAVG